jgi:hypothetical protein
MTDAKEPNDDDFYSAANWAEFADPDVNVAEPAPTPPQQAQARSRSPSPGIRGRRSPSPGGYRRSRSPPAGERRGGGGGGSGGGRSGQGYRRRSRSRSDGRSAEALAKRSRWGDGGPGGGSSGNLSGGVSRGPTGVGSTRRERDQTHRSRDEGSRGRERSAPPPRNEPLEVFKVYPGVVQRVRRRLSEVSGGGRNHPKKWRRAHKRRGARPSYRASVCHAMRDLRMSLPRCLYFKRCKSTGASCASKACSAATGWRTRRRTWTASRRRRG